MLPLKHYRANGMITCNVCYQCTLNVSMLLPGDFIIVITTFSQSFVVKANAKGTKTKLWLEKLYFKLQETMELIILRP